MCVGGETAKTQTGEPTVFPCQFPRHEAALDLILGLLHREQGVQPLNLHTQVFCEDSTNATYCELFFFESPYCSDSHQGALWQSPVGT